MNTHSLERIPPGKLFRCGFCLQSFLSSMDLVAHKREEHYEVSGPSNVPIVSTAPFVHRVSTTPIKNETTDHRLSSSSRTSSKSPIRPSPSYSDHRPIDSYFPRIDRSQNSVERYNQNPKKTRRVKGKRTFLCNVCNKRLMSLDSYKAHLRIHTGETPFSCLKCNRGFVSAKALHGHRSRTGVCASARPRRPIGVSATKRRMAQFSTRPANVSLHPSPIQNLNMGQLQPGTSSPGPQRTHIATTTKFKTQRRGTKYTKVKRTFVCNVCNKRLMSVCSYKAHLRLHTGETPYKCLKCNRGFYSAKAAYQHRYRTGTGNCAGTNGGKHRRPVGASTSTKPRMALVSSRPVNVPQKKTAASHGPQHTHTATTFKTNRRGTKYARGHFKCETCQKVLTSNHTYKDHLNLHTGERPHVCMYCPERFYSERRLSDHLTKCRFRQRTGNSVLKKRIRKTFLSGNNKKSVIISRSPFKKIAVGMTQVIQQNGQSVVISNASPRKMSSQTNNSLVGRDFVPHHPENTNNSGVVPESDPMNSSSKSAPESFRTCKFCQKVLNCPRACRDHERMHTGVRPYSCEECGQRYFSKTALQTHYTRTCKMMRRNKGGRSLGISNGHGSSFVSSRNSSPSKSVRNNKTFGNASATVTSEMDPLDLDDDQSTSVNNHPVLPNGNQKTWIHCPVCSKTLSNQDTLKSHIRHYHKSYAMSSSSSSHRNISYKTRGGLSQYLRDRKSAQKQRTNQFQYIPAEGTEDGFECPHCSKVLKGKINLRNHVRMHTGEKPFKCYYCPQKFHSHTSRHRHKNICEFRGSVQSGQPEGIRGGIKVEGTKVEPNYKESDSVSGGDTDEMDVDEDQMNNSFITKGMADNTPKPYQCLACPRSFYSSISLAGHRAMCSGSMNRMRNLVQTESDDSDSEVIIPPHIQRESSRKSMMFGKSVDNDMTAPVGNSDVDDSTEDDIPLDQLRSKTLTTQGTGKETTTTTEKENLNCPYCNRLMARVGTLEDHIRSKHTGERPFPCSTCPKRFHSSRTASQHGLSCPGGTDVKYRPSSTHTPELELVRGAVRRRNIREGCRVRTTTERQPTATVTAPSSNSDFAPENNEDAQEAAPEEPLSGRPRTTPTQSLNCPYCQKLFGRKQSLIVHIRLHTGEKPYKCNKCSMRFHDTIPLARHAAICDQRRAQDERRKLNEERIRIRNAQQAVDRAVPSSHLNQMARHPRSPERRIVTATATVTTETASGTYANGEWWSTPLIKTIRKYDLVVPPEDRPSTSRAMATATATSTAASSSAAPNNTSCRFCGKVMSTMSCLQDHERTHTGETPFKCTRCRRRFHSKRSLANHKRTNCSNRASNVRQQRMRARARILKLCPMPTSVPKMSPQGRQVEDERSSSESESESDDENDEEMDVESGERNGEELTTEEEDAEVDVEEGIEPVPERLYNKVCPICQQICFDVIEHIQTAHLNMRPSM